MARLCKRIKTIIWTKIVDNEQNISDMELGKEGRLSHIEPHKFDNILSEIMPDKQANLVELDNDDYFSPEEVKENAAKYKDEVIEVKEGIWSYQFGDLIGKGWYGQVYRGFDLDTGKIIAIKKVPILNFIDKDQVDVRLVALEKEIKLLSSFSHENIVKYLGNHHTTDSLNIFLEYVSSGSINSMLEKYGKFNETLVRIYTKYILQGLYYLHAHNVIHGDIKGSNVLVDDNGVCKLADFGGSNKIMGLKSK